MKTNFEARIAAELGKLHVRVKRLEATQASEDLHLRLAAREAEMEMLKLRLTAREAELAGLRAKLAALQTLRGENIS